MRKFTTQYNSQDWQIEFPDNVVFAYNPLYITVKAASVNLQAVFNVVCNDVTRSVNVEIFKGRCKIYFSRILQLFFEDYKRFRTLNFSVALSVGGTYVFSTSFLAIWGSMPLGGRYNAYGLFNFTGKAEYERTRIWFRKYPFKVSMFSVNPSPTIACRCDGSVVAYKSLPALPSGAPTNLEGEWVDDSGNIYQYDRSAMEYYKEDVGNGVEYGIFDVTPEYLFPTAKRTASLRIGERGTVNVFDDTFDYTFYQQGLSTHIVNLKVSDESAGYYLRWIDQYGELQYFLFSSGVVTQKNTLSSDTVADMEDIGPMSYPNHVRNAQITTSRTCKCCAVSLRKEIYEYVSSIVSAPIIDLYIGKSVGGREIWEPVNIVSSSHDYDTKKNLNDLTIAFTLPEYKSQTL